jgi:extracellular factor (EF) 3-hydroxypalmitic acid methyl ester biosynthesis protein
MQTTANCIPTPVIANTTLLDRVTAELKAGRIARALDELFDDLLARRAEDPAAWPEFARQCLSHELREFMYADPFTYRAFSKPRGYAGDALMMDYIYGLGEAKEAASNATPIGRDIFSYMGDRPSARAVRFRRALIAAMLDSAACREDARVVAIAAGHLREVELSRAVSEGKFSEFVAFDQDEATLAVVARDYARYGITPTPGSVRQILSGKVAIPPVRLRLRRRPLRLLVRSGGRRSHPADVRSRSPRRNRAHPELPYWDSRCRLHGGVHGLAPDLPRP